MSDLVAFVTTNAFIILCAFYLYEMLQTFAWAVAPILLIGEQRQDWYHEDLQQMHWERCMMAALPRLAVLLLMIILPASGASEYFFTTTVATGLFGDPLSTAIAHWFTRTILIAATIPAVAAIVGWAYFRIFRKQEHERRYQRFLDETVLMNVAYGPKQPHRQIGMHRPVRGSLHTRYRRPRL